jgi:hypothetical protein
LAQTRRRAAALIASIAALLAGCGGDDGGADGKVAADERESASADRGEQEGGSSGAGGDEIDVTNIDACALLDKATVKALTGESEDFVIDGRRGSCFWAVPRPGYPAYVEITIARQPGGLAALTYNPGQACRMAPLHGVGDEAEGATCPAPPQKKIYVRVSERGAIVTLLVNEPKRPLAPADLVPTAAAILDQL